MTANSESGLNENHNRRLAIAMRMVDAAAARILDLLDERTSPTAMTVVESKLTAETEGDLRRQLRALQQSAVDLAKKYRLARHRKDLQRVIAAELSEIWTVLEDCEPQRMKGFGAIGPSAARQLAEDLQPILKMVEDLDSRLRK